MSCVTCGQDSRLRGGKQRVRKAAGVCQDCSTAVCDEHGVRIPGRADAFYCRECAAVRDLAAETPDEVGRPRFLTR
jgi:hypothetical protein